MIAEAVKEAVGIGRHARGGERHQRADSGGLALQGQFGKQLTVYVGVEGWVGFDQVARGLHRNGGAGGGDLENQFEIRAHRGANLKALTHSRKPVGRDVDPVGVEGDAGKLELAIDVGGHSPV